VTSKDWFMHMHKGESTHVCVYPSTGGCYVRSCDDGWIKVDFYPQAPATRATELIWSLAFPPPGKISIETEDEIATAVTFHMEQRGV